MESIKNLLQTVMESHGISMEELKNHPPQKITKAITNPTLVEKSKYWLSRKLKGGNRTEFKTKYSFLNSIKALATGNFNVIAARTGKGKSDLLISMLVENLLNGYPVGLFLTEGEIDDYRKQIFEILKHKLKDETKVESLMARVMAFEYEDVRANSIYDYKGWVNSFFNLIRSHSIEIVYFDNLTTINFTNSSPEVESGFVDALVKGAKKLGICLNAAIHPTKSHHANSEITLDVFRGNANHVNMATNVIAMNNFDNINSGLRVAKILKSKYFGWEVGSGYDLQFKKLPFRGFYKTDKKLSPIQLKKYFIENNRKFPTARN